MLLVIFVLAAVVCIGSSVLLVSRLERVGERLRLAEAFLGLVVALATDGPEITSALTAAITGQRTVGVGVALGSNAFNLATMLGVGVVMAGGLPLPRLATMLEGSLALLIALIARGWPRPTRSSSMHATCSRCRSILPMGIRNRWNVPQANVAAVSSSVMVAC